MAILGFWAERQGYKRFSMKPFDDPTLPSMYRTAWIPDYYNGAQPEGLTAIDAPTDMWESLYVKMPPTTAGIVTPIYKRTDNSGGTTWQSTYATAVPLVKDPVCINFDGVVLQTFWQSGEYGWMRFRTTLLSPTSIRLEMYWNDDLLDSHTKTVATGVATKFRAAFYDTSAQTTFDDSRGCLLGWLRTDDDPRNLDFCVCNMSEADINDWTREGFSQSDAMGNNVVNTSPLNPSSVNIATNETIYYESNTLNLFNREIVVAHKGMTPVGNIVASQVIVKARRVGALGATLTITDADANGNNEIQVGQQSLITNWSGSVYSFNYVADPSVINNGVIDGRLTLSTPALDQVLVAYVSVLHVIDKSAAPVTNPELRLYTHTVQSIYRGAGQEIIPPTVRVSKVSEIDVYDIPVETFIDVSNISILDIDKPKPSEQVSNISLLDVVRNDTSPLVSNLSITDVVQPVSNGLVSNVSVLDVTEPNPHALNVSNITVLDVTRHLDRVTVFNSFARHGHIKGSGQC